MKINKALCRKHSGQLLQIRSNHGLLHAQQIHWLVTASVKIIGHHRTLILNVYSRDLAAKGNFAARWTVYQTKDDYITLERKVDGSTVWRTGAFEKLANDWYFITRCAFVSHRDEQRITDFFHDGKWTGFNSLKHAQYAIQSQRRAKREKQKQHKIRERMRPIPAVPRGLKQWVQRQVMPAYLFIQKQDSRRSVLCLCSACGKVGELSGLRHNEKTTCPHCGRVATVKSRARTGHLYDRDTVQVIQGISTSEAIIRIFKVYNNPITHKLEVRESIRQFIRQKPDGDLATEDYYLHYGQWKQGTRPTYVFYRYQFEGDTCAFLYTGNLPAALKDTPWQYTPIKQFAEHFSNERMQARPFLAADTRHSRLEHLCKVGFFNLASDLAYKGDYNHTLDETQNRTHRILGVAAEDVPFLRELDVDIATIQKFHQYGGLRDRQALLLWQLQHDVKYNMEEILRLISPHKLMKFLDHQKSHPDPQAKSRYVKMQNLVTEYRDYLDLCRKLGDDLADDFVLFPRNLRKAHDQTARRLEIKVDKTMRRDFNIAYHQVQSHKDFTMAGLQMVCPTEPEEIAKEGKALHHCVGNYLDRVAKKKCLILFLRQTSDLAKPFYTVEVREQKAVQVRGYKNADPTPEVQTFIAAWERQVLQAAYGFVPTTGELQQLQTEFVAWNGDKEAFTNDFHHRSRAMDFYKARADEIARLLDQLSETEQRHSEELAAKDRLIDDLKLALKEAQNS